MDTKRVVARRRRFIWLKYCNVCVMCPWDRLDELRS